MSDIFLSYCHDDHAHAERLAKALASKGWSVWWDRVIPAGREFAEVIEEEIDAARCVVVVWSRAAVQSRWIRTEASAGLERDVLVPVQIEAVEKLPLAFRQLQVADLSGWQGSVVEARFQQVVTGVDRALARQSVSWNEAQSPESTASIDVSSRDHRTPLPLHRQGSSFSTVDELVVPASRFGLFTAALAGTALVVVGIFPVLTEPGAFNLAAALVGVPFFSLVLAYCIWRLARPKPALVINRIGIFDNGSAVGVGLIKWEEIEDLKEYSMFGQTILGISLVDPKVVLARVSPWKRRMLQFNRWYGTPTVNIPGKILPMRVGQLLREIAVRFGH